MILFVSQMKYSNDYLYDVVEERFIYFQTRVSWCASDDVTRFRLSAIWCSLFLSQNLSVENIRRWRHWLRSHSLGDRAGVTSSVCKLTFGYLFCAEQKKYVFNFQPSILPINQVQLLINKLILFLIILQILVTSLNKKRTKRPHTHSKLTE